MTAAITLMAVGLMAVELTADLETMAEAGNETALGAKRHHHECNVGEGCNGRRAAQQLCSLTRSNPWRFRAEPTHAMGSLSALTSSSKFDCIFLLA